jgi:hypothetical protein
VPAPTSWLTFLHLFAGCFNAPSQVLFEQLVTAWALCPGRRTLTHIWSVIPAECRRGYSAYARWVREGDWSMDELWRRLVVHLVEHLVPDRLLTLLLDDTLVNKSGRKVDGAGFFHDAVTSTAVAHKVTARASTRSCSHFASPPRGAASRLRCPASANQFPVPSEQGLRPGEQRRPGGPGHESAEGTQEQTVRRLPAGATDLTLEHTELVSKGENLGPKPDLRLAVGEQGVQEEADDSVEEGEGHGDGA